MEEQRFVPSEEHPLDGGVILNNVMAHIAAAEFNFPRLSAVAGSHLVKASNGVKQFFANAKEQIYAAMDEQAERGVPMDGMDCLLPVVTDNELAGFYRPFRIAMQALFDVARYNSLLFVSSSMMPLRRTMCELMSLYFYDYLMLSKAFRDTEEQKWHNSGLLRFFDREYDFFSPS